MKTIFFALILILPLSVQAQELLTSQFGDTVTAYRYDKSKLKNKDAIIRIGMLESSLDKCKTMVKSNIASSFYDDFSVQKVVIKDVCPDCNLNIFDNEIKFYRSYFNKMTALKDYRVDSAKKADLAFYETKKQQQKMRSDSFRLADKKADSIKWEETKIAQAKRDSNYIAGFHGKLVNIIGHPVNSVINYVGMYLQDDFEFTESNSPKKNLPFHIKLVYAPKISTNPKRKVTIDYVVNSESRITNFTIDGYYTDVINFFLNYWPTKSDFDEGLKNEIAVKYLMTDKIVLTGYPATSTARIVLSSNR